MKVMKKVLLLCLGLLLLNSCKHPSWHKTTEGIYIYCIANDKYKLSWKGDTKAGMADGEGRLVSYNKEGEYKEQQGLKVNWGVAKEWNYISYGNYKYLGKLHKDLPNGFGVKIQNDTISIGKFKKSVLYNGFCEKYLITGTGVLPLFSGTYKKGKVHGLAKYYENGVICFEGNFRKGMRKGLGQKYENGVLVYEGNFSKNLKDGYGKAYKNGRLWYEGQWNNGKREGKGKLYNESGLLVYDGHWDEDLYDGKGKLYENGVCIEGKWEEGLLSKSISTSTFKQMVHATKIWFNDTLDTQNIETQEPISLADNQVEFVEQLQTDIETMARKNFSERLDKRFGFWNLFRMLCQPWFSSDVSRARHAQKYFCKHIGAEDIQQLINTKVDYYNQNVPEDKKMHYVKIEMIPDGTIVDTNTALKIFDREAIETTDTLAGIFIDIVICLVIAFVIGFILGFFVSEEFIPYAGIIDIILGIIAFGVGIYISFFKTSAICIELEEQILDMLVNNYMQFIESQNIIIQMFGLL